MVERGKQFLRLLVEKKESWLSPSIVTIVMGLLGIIVYILIDAKSDIRQDIQNLKADISNVELRLNSSTSEDKAELLAIVKENSEQIKELAKVTHETRGIMTVMENIFGFEIKILPPEEIEKPEE